ncbi:SMP-30/gluconolactonase/LRE family protein [Fluviibacterium sp. DFM31]|uniref:SMP-30/gluconolactonase/LRE family protein n=1 Tax=Meridianimarinicoccus marinus TaxID=3231483 RepID=A0ABV3LA62_9RHOB
MWWLDIQAQRLLRTDMNGKTQATPCPWQPGLVALAESGALVEWLETGLWTYAPETGDWRQVSDTEANHPTLCLNDGKPDCHGRLFFGSMDMTGTGQATGRLYCRTPDGAIQVLRDGITVPNAIAPLADGSGLWFADFPTGGPAGDTLFLTSQRRFLTADELEAQPAAGGLLAQKVRFKAAPTHVVRGL